MTERFAHAILQALACCLLPCDGSNVLMEDAAPYRSPHFYQLGADAQSALVKRSVVIKGHKTSISLEDIFWAALRHIALDQNTTISEIVARIDAKRNGSTRSSAIRQYIMADMQDRAWAR